MLVFQIHAYDADDAHGNANDVNGGQDISSDEAAYRLRIRDTGDERGDVCHCDRQRNYHERACSRNIKSILGTFSFSFLPFCSCLNQCNFQSIV